MIVLLAIGGALTGLVALAASRRGAPQQAAAGSPVQAPPAQPRVVQSREPEGDGGKKGDGADLGAGGVLAAAGIAGGLLARESAFTKEAKDVSIPIGIGVATAAYLATSFGGAAVIGATGVAVAGAGAAAYLIAPIVLVTVAIVTIVDGIMRSIKAGEWRKFCLKIAELRSQGKFREALALWVKENSKFEPIVRVWPQPYNRDLPAFTQTENWYNAADPLGRPYPGFPGAPAPATAADVARWPEIVPSEIFTTTGESILVRGLFESLRQDIDDVRAWGLANKAPGSVVVNGKLTKVTEGDRSLVGWPPFDKARQNLADWALKIGAATPWLEGGALQMYQPTPADQALRAAEIAAQKAATAAKAAKVTARVSKAYGLTPAEVAAERADAAEAAAETTASRAQESRERETTTRNTSGSGGRNA